MASKDHPIHNREQFYHLDDGLARQESPFPCALILRYCSTYNI